MKALILAAVLANHFVGPAGRPPIHVDCAEIPAMIAQLTWTIEIASTTPDLQARAAKLRKYLQFFYRHECAEI